MSDADVVAEGGEAFLADSGDLVELVDRSEAAVLGAVVEDLLGRGGADAVEGVELLEGRGVQIDRLIGGGGGCRGGAALRGGGLGGAGPGGGLGGVLGLCGAGGLAPGGSAGSSPRGGPGGP